MDWTGNDHIDVIRDMVDAKASRVALVQFSQYLDFWDAEYRGSWKIEQAAQNHEGILTVIENLNRFRSLPRYKVVAKLREDLFPSSAAELVGHSVDLAVRRWLMLNVTETFSQLQLLWPQTVALNWRDEESLLAFVGRLFPGPQTVMTINTINYLDDAFIATSIMKYAKLEVRFTTSLEDHLRLRFDGGGRILRVFNHKQWLLKHLNLAGARISGFVNDDFHSI